MSAPPRFTAPDRPADEQIRSRRRAGRSSDRPAAARASSSGGTGLRVAMVHLSDFRLDSRVQRQARALAERGDQVDLVCIGEREELRFGEGIIRVHPVGGTKVSEGSGSYLRGYGAFLARAFVRLTALDLRRRFDLVEVHNMPDLLTAAALGPRLRGAPVILDVHDTFPELFATKFDRPMHDPLVRLVEREERLSAALATHVLAVTEQARGRLEGRGVGVGRTVVVMNSPDERVFGPSRPPVELPAHGPLRVLYHGGLADRFGVETLINAFARVRESAPRLQLRICGSGEDRDRLAALAAQIDPERIDVAREPVPFAQIPDELAAAHIGVVPTLRDHFTELLLPVKLLEYVHMGLSVLASRLPGIESCFSDADVRMFEPGDCEDLASAMQTVLADPAAARKRASGATQRLQSIAWERQREGYLGLVDELVAGRTR